MAVSTIIEISKISQYLANIDVLRGANLDYTLPRKLYMVRKNVEWLYDLDPSDSTLTQTANFLYSLCGQYGLQAQSILGSGGGSITPITPPSSDLPQVYDFIIDTVTTSDAPLKVGDTSIVLDGTNGTRDFRGYNLSFDRGGQPQYTTDKGDGSTYFGWDRDTGLFQLFNGAAQLTEPFRITPIG